ncbi:2TM domain-containing protein [Nonlabens sp. Hel1_33_55]|uniref:2TM domain-containing protein n=1 Tax=Nonlabens sp. Hel1_33_55 TaxID=1336802 RepID=UPI000875F01D|nr:2TM domain-containing protein [Nonlabens sp. Hel1_33_55]SCY09442.1 2TM domain-containing protein [Nonlabens sp. Hel1_33_55]
MNTQESYQERYTRAKARVEELKAFYNHVIIYLIINSGLAALNYYSNEWSFPWFLFPLLGWGIGLLSHAAGVFRLNPFTGKDWENRKLQELMENEEDQTLINTK